jgi:glutamine amidotransferase
MIAIIDYNLGNVGSIQNMLNKIGVENIITNCPEKIKNAKKLILPGVGSFDTGMQNLHELGLVKVLQEAVDIDKKPILGICLGMQLMTIGSEEGIEQGLNWLPLKIINFKNIKNYEGNIPLMGWNYVTPTKENKLLNKNNYRFYFVHSYHCQTNEFQILSAQINDYEYCAAFQKGNIYGVQFHPEKSHKFGLDLLVNFCNL